MNIQTKINSRSLAALRKLRMPSVCERTNRLEAIANSLQRKFSPGEEQHYEAMLAEIRLDNLATDLEVSHL